MYSFKNDYSEGAHPNIIKALVESNDDQLEGYGLDPYSHSAARTIRQLVHDDSAEVHLLNGGTQTNLIAISAMLEPYEACITVESGHIATHEAGAIEATGHKLLTVNSADGKIRKELIEPILAEHCNEHMVVPRLVYISNPTEFGTVYSKAELEELRDYCNNKDLLLYCDGARVASAIACQEAELSLKTIYDLTDALFIGGTKNGILFGEALVFRNTQFSRHLRHHIKQKGALLAKGRVLGVQFNELFKDNLYLQLAQNSNDTAQFLVSQLKKRGCSFFVDSPTNQIFPIMENQVIDKLAEAFAFYTWAKVSETHSAIRIVTSWATSMTAVNSFIEKYTQLTEQAS